MKPTILIDLDDTLLDNDIQVFLPAYLRALSEELSAFAEPKKLISTLLKATQLMVKNRRPDCTLKEVFDNAFYPNLGVSPADLQEPIERFYAEVFPGLKEYTKQNPDAPRIIEAALEKGYRIAIATNPMFPRTAVLQRLAWAGLPADQYPFEIITSFETFHFSKPDPAYYAELMARLNWPEGPVVMIGDDLERDIAGANRLGLATFWVPARNALESASGQSSPTGSNSLASGSLAAGPLAAVIPWLDSMPEESLRPDYNLPSAILAILLSTPAALDSLCRDLPAQAWTDRPGSGEWSLTEILCHLRDVEREVNLPRLRKMLSEEQPFLPGMDTDPWAEERQYIHQNGLQALHRFTATRMELLALLETLQVAEWQRIARHAIFGPTRLIELTNINAGHDRLHIQQIHHNLSVVLS